MKRTPKKPPIVDAKMPLVGSVAEWEMQATSLTRAMLNGKEVTTGLRLDSVQKPPAGGIRLDLYPEPGDPDVGSLGDRYVLTLRRVIG